MTLAIRSSGGNTIDAAYRRGMTVPIMGNMICLDGRPSAIALSNVNLVLVDGWKGVVHICFHVGTLSTNFLRAWKTGDRQIPHTNQLLPKEMPNLLYLDW